MGTCTFCGQKAGFLKTKHSECENNYIAGKQNIIKKISSTITQTSDFDNLENEIKNISAQNFIKPEEILNLYISGFDEAVNSLLDDGVLSTEEEDRITKFNHYYKFEQDVVNKNGSWEKLVKASVLRDIIEGKTPSKFNIKGNLPFMLQKDENIIWVFQNVEFYELRSKTRYEGGSHGMSFRIAKGLTYRTGAFKGRPVVTEQMEYIDNGLVALTNLNLYFASSKKNIKIPYKKMVTVEPYADGVQIQKDGANTKPQVFKCLDGLFVYNLISNLGKA